MIAKLTEARFAQLANQLARNYAPPIYACKKCHHPVIEGNICSFCGDTSPSYPPEKKKRAAA